MFSLEDLCADAGWELAAETADAMTLTAEGHTLTAAIPEDATALMRDLATSAVVHCEEYAVQADGAEVVCAQGDLVYYEGKWYISRALMENALGAQVTYDEEEKAVLIRLVSPELSGAEG